MSPKRRRKPASNWPLFFKPMPSYVPKILGERATCNGRRKCPSRKHWGDCRSHSWNRRRR